MSGSQPQKIGGEYGEVRASIDVQKLHSYLASNVKAIQTPVVVKQFKVCDKMCRRIIVSDYGNSLDRYNLRVLPPHVDDVSTVVQSNLFPDGRKVRMYRAPLIFPDFIYSCSKKRFVLRKKPAGQLMSNTAHQVEREYTILRALHRHNINPSTAPHQIVPVPEPIVLCEDSTVIGTPFYVMEFLEGRIFTDSRMLVVSPDDRRQWYVNPFCTS
jgi:aminoglycoside phosphotransferase (APT) family kinase protein